MSCRYNKYLIIEFCAILYGETTSSHMWSIAVGKNGNNSAISKENAVTKLKVYPGCFIEIFNETLWSGQSLALSGYLKLPRTFSLQGSNFDKAISSVRCSTRKCGIVIFVFNFSNYMYS